uniref:Protein kinase domain-containing protein n=1 Tax=Globisporangium ultimum (strain ATCC 200006 / CBS 805.95 / DAOM BR144) TaxID=431595 RepID=K3WQI6_GLOUD
MLSAMVKFRAKKGNIPTRPGVMNDKQWNLIELMTNQDPSERVKIAFVVDKLFEISEAEKTAIPAPVGLP